MPHLYARHRGVVVVALRQPNRERILARLDWFLTHFPEESLPGHVVLLKDRTYVVYPGAVD